MESAGELGGAGARPERAEKIERAKAALVRKFDIEAEFVGVPALARALGLAVSTIYGLIRAGTFCVPHRLVGSTVLVRLDDLAEWVCFGEVEAPAPSPGIGHVRRRAKPIPVAAPEPEQTVEEIVEEARRSMGMRGSRR